MRYDQERTSKMDAERWTKRLVSGRPVARRLNEQRAAETVVKLAEVESGR